MHTVEILSYTDFNFAIEGQDASLEDILPGFNKCDRIGVVVRQPGGGMGASALLMAALTRFYDLYRPLLGDEPGKLRIYPEFFVFHVGRRHMNHSWMDIWPPHKEVVVEDDPEQILEAINDRGITRLLVEDLTPSSATFLRETISSAEHRIVSALAYSPTGRVDKADVQIISCSVAEDNVLYSLNMSEELSKEVKEELAQARKHLLVGGRVAETYRRIELADAFHMLTLSTEPGTTTRSYMSLLGISNQTSRNKHLLHVGKR
ncbi:hypothetical protein CVD25_22635 [Bacillus canaveralius]|uniref:Uncharacterized protein n=1 Tax=Bacillus canaveralius TaxID=1403243 RepID=A0A2N5GGR7_9BACI|nr:MULTISPECIES: hypothetical protein [Bacillus]PLR79931.1 hypothetical protein CU635_20465 [Bacillus canaveralius]PLR83507.1 hypothetical protein CVD23_14210 [Bacillus sp. V33-4]PLR88440.1 hypothetical protein CVD25_22635 [Bacillus canaveralius]RSK58170.1 hypothetical protein EJA13_00150 [Bacillus canaveralius]